MSTLSNRASAKHRFVLVAAQYAITHNVGFLLEAGVDLGLMQEDVDMNGDLGVQLMPWVESNERKARVSRPKRTGGQKRRKKQVDKVDIVEVDTNVVQLRKVDIGEVDILRSQGLTHEAIAERLGVSTKTVQRKLRQSAS
jgi:DNA-binding NarL/FixJ family response regulator